MKQFHDVPEIAILGHPNEGKSSVLSTLAEDDSVRVSAFPGETVVCRSFPVIIDGREVLRFTDTPGFQNPFRVVAELGRLAEEPGDCIIRFREKFHNDPDLADDIELLAPVAQGAGIVYVVDGSRPVRNVDKAEIEILRLSGRPRMAIVNCKNDAFDYLEDWKKEFRRNFNANRVFNAHRATYAERISLLETLQSVDQDWQPILEEVLIAVKADWKARNQQTVDIILDLLTDCLSYSLSAKVSHGADHETLRTGLVSRYYRDVQCKEQDAHNRMRRLFKHNIFRAVLPEESFLHQDLFSEQTWKLFGLSKTQVAIMGGIGGAALGAGVDLALGGAALGLVTGISGAAGSLGALWGSRRIAGQKVMGLRLGSEQCTVGPTKEINLLFVLLNRALLYYKHTINWAHGCRNYELLPDRTVSETVNVTASWSPSQLRIARSFFKKVTENSSPDMAVRQRFAELIFEELNKIGRAEK